MEEDNEPSERQGNRIYMLRISCLDERGVASARAGRQNNVYEYGSA